MLISVKSGSLSERLRAALVWVVALAIAFFNPIPAQAQPLVGESRTITPIASGSGSLHPMAQELVITNETDYANFFGGTPPSSPTVNFSAEDVLAVTLGSQPPGSSVSIPSVDVRTTGFTAGWGFVHVVPTIGTPVPPVTISGGTASNSLGAFSETGGTFVYSGGTFRFTPTQFTGTGGAFTSSGGTETITGGTTTAGSNTYPGWSLSNIGGSISGAGAVSGGGGTLSWTGGTASTTSLGIQIVGGVVTVTGGTATSAAGPFAIAGGTTTLTPPTVTPFTVIKVNKGALAYAFVSDLPLSIIGPLFSRFTYTIGGGAAPYNERISVDSSAFMTIQRSTGTTGGTEYSGAMTSEESQLLAQAFQAGNIPILPSTVPGGSTLTILPSETISSVIGSQTYSTTMVQAGFYNGDSNLKNLVDAIRGPAERIVRDTQLTGHLDKGTVSLTSSGLSVGSRQISPEDPFFNLIAAAAGNEVAFDRLGKSSNPSVLFVVGTLSAGVPLLTFPSAGADVQSTLPAGSTVNITNRTLFGNYLEVTISSGQRGFVDKEVVRIPIQ